MPTIEDADRTVDEFEALLSRYRVKVAIGSRLESTLLFARHVLHVRGGEEPREGDDRANWREMIGTLDLAQRLVVAAGTMPERFEGLVPWLKIFASTTGQLAQCAPTTQGDQDSDRIFELLVALCLLPHVSKITPDVGRGDNPDLLFRFHERSWGIACKRLYSRKPERFRDTVRTAITQIESSSAECGLVFVNLVNLINHDAFYPMRDDVYVGMHREQMLAILESEQERLSSQTVACTDDELTDAFVAKKALPGVIHYLGTTYLTGSEDAPVLKTVQRGWSRGDVGELLQVFQAGLNSTSSSST